MVVLASWISASNCAGPPGSGAPKPTPNLRSDTFNSCSLQTFWTFTDPVGGASTSATGVGTSNPELVVSIPAGNPHDIQPAANQACRLVQESADSDLDLRVQVQPRFTAPGQMAGIMIEAGDSNLLTLSVANDTAGLVVWAQTLDAQTPTQRATQAVQNTAGIWLALTRSGNDWTLQYSTDGQQFSALASYTWDVVVSRVGLFAANTSAGSTAGFSAMFTSFQSSNDPLTSGNQPAGGYTLTTSVAGGGAVETTPSQPAYYCGEQVTVTAKPADGWLFSHWTGDLSGEEPQQTLRMSTSRSVNAVFVSRGFPVISHLKITPNHTGAVVTWSTDVPASSKVSYGRTIAYEAGAISVPDLATDHSITISGLVRGQLCHVQVASADADGDETRSGDETFTAGDMSGIMSDDFNDCTLSAIWTVVDPRGDTEVVVTGVGTADALLNLNLPAGSSHDIAAGTDNTVRVLQPTADTDFRIDTKLQSRFVAGTQAGMIVQSGSGAALRFYASYESGAFQLRSLTYAGAAATDRGSKAIENVTPLWLSIERTGDAWALRYSTDGQTWLDHKSFTWAASITRVGMLAGNSSAGGNVPAFTASFDYFANALSPLTAEDIVSRAPAAILQSQVSGSGALIANPDRSAYYCGESIQLTAAPTQGWLFDHWSGDLSGTNPQAQLTMSQSRSVTATFVLDSRPLIISNAAAVSNTNGGVFSWTTNKPATTEVRYGQTASYELGTVSDGQYVLVHSIAVSGLLPTATYHYSLRSTDQLGNVQSTPDATFKTGPTGAFVSDDFNCYNLNPAVWSIHDPLGDASFSVAGVNTSNAQLRIAVPAGVTHDISGTGVITAPHVIQKVNDTDFSVSLKFESGLSQWRQVQGVLIQQDALKLIRADFAGGNSATNLYIATISNGTTTTILDAPINAATPLFERITRTGDTWNVYYSHDGSNWTNGASFSFPMQVSTIGVWAGNTGGSPPAFTTAIDYFFNDLAPITPEDGTQVTDIYPPNLITPNAQPNGTSVVVGWHADEPVTAQVSYGLTTGYELGTVSGHGSLARDSVNIGSLQQQTTYHFRILARDAAGNSAQSGDLTATTGTSTPGPTVNLWYGTSQEFGRIGTPQPFANVLGNVSDPSGVTALSYTLNGGPANTLSMGPDTRRLASAGDFNVDLPFTSLRPGANQVSITAVNGLGQSTVTNVQVIDSTGPVWPLPYSIDWSHVSNISDVAQVIDGLWRLDGATVRPSILAYDRLIGIGDITWQDYEVLVPITPYDIDPAGYAAPSYGPGVGVLLRWPGHTQDSHQPWEGVYPLGALGMYRWTTGGNQWQMFGNNGVLLQTLTEPLTFGVTLMYRMRVQTDPTTSAATYKLRVWPAGTTEPTTWKVTGTQSASVDPGHGCLLLLAHHVDATFGPVSVTPGPFSN